jgi:FkbM family methyltransferase
VANRSRLFVQKPRACCLDFGIGDDISFELELIRRYGAQVYAFDPTPMSMEWLATHSQPPPQFHAFAVGVANFDGVQSFGRPRVAGTLDFSARRADRDAAACPVKKLSTIVQEYRLSHIEILKMDVEGSEYAVLEDLAQSHIRPTQLCIEFHHGMDDIRVSETTGAIRQLQSRGYRMFDVAPWGHEISLILRSAIV